MKLILSDPVFIRTAAGFIMRHFDRSFDECRLFQLPAVFANVEEAGRLVPPSRSSYNKTKKYENTHKCERFKTRRRKHEKYSSRRSWLPSRSKSDKSSSFSIRFSKLRDRKSRQSRPSQMHHHLCHRVHRSGAFLVKTQNTRIISQSNASR